MKWIETFLCFRQQRVVVNGVKTDWAPVGETITSDLRWNSHIRNVRDTRPIELLDS